jgi:hypothetical protein
MRDYRTHLQAVAKRAPRTINNALAAVDDFYTRLGLGPAGAKRVGLPKTAPRALARRAAVKFLREVERWPSPRDKAIALVPFYSGARISEVVGPDVDDVAMSARKGTLRIYGKGEKVREVPIHPRYEPSWPAGSANAPAGPAPADPHCSSTRRAAGSQLPAPTTSSPRSPHPPGSTRTPPLTP